MRRIIGFGILAILALGVVGGGVILYMAHVPDPYDDFSRDPFPRPEVNQVPIPSDAIASRMQRRQATADALGVEDAKQILFGDTHVHSTYSLDAFATSLPIMGGSRGAFPPADACDYARYVSQLDFYFLTDHAESYTPQHWRDEVESVRLCNEVAGDPVNPDVVAFIGWEWTQVGLTAEEHYGHHNVLFRDTEPGTIPARPIAAAGITTTVMRSNRARLKPIIEFLDFTNRSYYEAFNANSRAMAETPVCADGVPSPDLPADCFEAVSTTGDLFRKLDEWGFDTIVIPHGMAWGIHTPPNVQWEKLLTAKDHDPDKTRLIEIYSGHGNSEVYRDLRARRFDENGNPYCPEPQDDYLPSCWQAGEIIRARCTAEGEKAAECDRRAATARQLYADVPNVAGWLTVPGSTEEEWLDAGQLRNAFLPAFNYRPGKSVQYGLALRNFDDPENVLQYRWGFVGSTDVHTARPGHGFKPFMRRGAALEGTSYNAFWRRMRLPDKRKPTARAEPLPDYDPSQANFSFTERERRSSFLYLGGIAAVHAKGRNREAIWDALKRKEVYATSGPRILLWFDLLNGGPAPLPMGSEVRMREAPRFRIRASGDFKQLPGCPEYVREALSARRLEHLSEGECYNPSDERYRIERIEVVRIRPQNYSGEPIVDLIDDPWLVLPCPDNPEGCTAEFTDEEFGDGQRSALYYVRAIQEPTPTVNGANLRTQYDAEGKAVSVDPCYSDYRTALDDECLADVSQRAWSSPIYVDYEDAQP